MTQVTDAMVAALQAMVEATRSAVNDPADQVRLLLQMATFTAAGTPSVTAIGQAAQAATTATAAMCRRAALGSLATACANYQPDCADDANQVLSAVVPVFDAEITSAADAGDSGSYASLRALRTAVVADLQARGSILPTLTTTYGLQPARVVAYRLYGDATREDEILARNPSTPFPGVMPLVVNVLSV